MDTINSYNKDNTTNYNEQGMGNRQTRETKLKTEKIQVSLLVTCEFMFSSRVCLFPIPFFCFVTRRFKHFTPSMAQSMQQIEPVAATADDAILSKLSCVRLNYYQDRYVEQFFCNKKDVRRSPIINRFVLFVVFCFSFFCYVNKKMF